MPTPQTLKAQIKEAFAATKYPGDDLLRGSNEGVEPFRVERDFRGKRDWKSLSPQFIDGAPDGLASALCFFSHEAFQFYLPAYLVADLDDQLERIDPVYYLTHGLERSSASERINPRRFAGRTWRDYARERFAGFTREQAAAIAAYLIFKRDADDVLDSTRQEIDDALQDYWKAKAGNSKGS
jgi:hypothetical protein